MNKKRILANENLLKIQKMRPEDIEFKPTKVYYTNEHDSFDISILGSETIAKFRFGFHGHDIYIYAQHSENAYFSNAAIDFEDVEKSKIYLYNLLKKKFRERKIVKNGKVIYPFEYIEKSNV